MAIKKVVDTFNIPDKVHVYDVNTSLYKYFIPETNQILTSRGFLYLGSPMDSPDYGHYNTTQEMVTKAIRNGLNVVQIDRLSDVLVKPEDKTVERPASSMDVPEDAEEDEKLFEETVEPMSPVDPTEDSGFPDTSSCNLFGTKKNRPVIGERMTINGLLYQGQGEVLDTSFDNDDEDDDFVRLRGDNGTKYKYNATDIKQGRILKLEENIRV